MHSPTITSYYGRVYYILPLQLPGGHVELADLSSMEEVSGCVHPEACCGLSRRCGPWWPGQNDRIWLANMLGWVGSCGFRAGKRPGRTWLIYTYICIYYIIISFIITIIIIIIMMLFRQGFTQVMIFHNVISGSSLGQGSGVGLFPICLPRPRRIHRTLWNLQSQILGSM